DRTPRELTDRQLSALRRLAEQISRELRLRRDLERLRASTRPAQGINVRPGTMIGDRFRVVRELGRGSVGAVFEANDAQGERVAVKLLLPEWRAQEQVVERFAREARVLMRLKT